MTALGGIYLAFLLIRRGRQALAMPEMRSIDAGLDASATEGAR